MTRRAAQRKRHGRRAVGEGVMCLVGVLVCLAIGFFEGEDTYLLKHRGELVSAVVLEEIAGKTSHITVRFTTLAGEQITGDTSNYLDADRGQTIQVVYDPQDPSRMQAADWGFDYVLPGVFAGMALVLLVFGIAHLRA